MLGNRRERMGWGRAMQRIVALGAIVTCLGCAEKGPSFDPTKDEGAINILLVDVAESGGSPFATSQVWDKASVPKDLAKYKQYSYSAIEKEVEPTSAKLKVEIKDMQGTVVATKDWTATKADGSWKLNSAPLP